ncbi:MAG: SET domain-containing protein-lysine N-methyltransferase, partial [Pollutimonas bauzanensis]
MTLTSKPWHIVKQSTLHGTGVFAASDIPAGTRIIEYGGRRITPEQADERHPVNPDDPFHTFFFSLSSGKVIDGGDKGNETQVRHTVPTLVDLGEKFSRRSQPGAIGL